MRGQIEGQISMFEYLDSLPKECSFSGHTCNKKNLWEVADTLDELQCPHVCCRQCNTRYCGARCNGSEEPKSEKGKGGIYRYLRYGPHTLIPEVRDEIKAYLEENGVPDWVKWDKRDLPCQNCTWYDGTACCSGGHTCHFEFDYLICDGFYQSIVERKPSTVGDAFPSIKTPINDTILKQPICDIDLRGLCDDPYCPVCGYEFKDWGENNEIDCDRCPQCHNRVSWEYWHKVNDEEYEDGSN